MMAISAALIASVLALVPLKKLSETAVMDAYGALKGAIKKKFSANNKVAGALDGLEDDPETWEKPLAKALDETDAATDSEIIALVTALQQALENAGVSITVSGTQSGGTSNIQQNIGSVSGGTVIGQQINKGDTLTDHARKIDTGGGDYHENG